MFPGSAVTRAEPKGERSKFMHSGPQGRGQSKGTRIQVSVIRTLSRVQHTLKCELLNKLGPRLKSTHSVTSS
ncbi:hypothetical protein Cenrod_2668 [Candidatus Symbiobacter mobilis CR]|uniref:Uncharacterized protein n=1 Tax=Candidatus Symbiobacter mobilis CR TaxID=946483 RepID=U5NEQ6_9BURK|nr:hypothetical protein Cenrod_2668 [Candidatus Symbiobacter mobilis CR]